MSNETIHEWCAVKARMDCLECGQSIPIEGPLDRVECPTCRTEVRLGQEWARILRELSKQPRTGREFVHKIRPTEAGTIFVSYAVGAPPRCPACDAAFTGLSEPAVGEVGAVSCPSCDAEYPVDRAPRHLQSRNIKQVFLASPPRDDPAADRNETRPVLLGCLGCGARLTITADMPRVVRCGYCESDSFVPPDVWIRLHPVRVRRAFWLRSPPPVR